MSSPSNRAGPARRASTSSLPPSPITPQDKLRASPPSRRFSVSTASPPSRRASVSAASPPSRRASVSGAASPSTPKERVSPKAAGSPTATMGSLASPSDKASVKLALLRVSESVEAAVAALDLEMPTPAYGFLINASSFPPSLTAAPSSSSPASPSPSRRSPSPGGRANSPGLNPNYKDISALMPPAIPVRSLSPGSLRPVVATEVAFGRHQSPPRSRPASPNPKHAALPPRTDGLNYCDNGCGRGATTWCDKCEIEICPICDAGIHGGNAALRRHARVHLVDRLPVCLRHREACKLFCSDCAGLICQQCVSTAQHKFPDGRGHPIFDVDAAADARRPEILELAKTLRAAAGSAPSVLKHLEAREALMLDQVSCRSKAIYNLDPSYISRL